MKQLYMILSVACLGYSLFVMAAEPESTHESLVDTTTTVEQEEEKKQKKAELDAQLSNESGLVNKNTKTVKASQLSPDTHRALKTVYESQGVTLSDKELRNKNVSAEDLDAAHELQRDAQSSGKELAEHLQDFDEDEENKITNENDSNSKRSESSSLENYKNKLKDLREEFVSVTREVLGLEDLFIKIMSPDGYSKLLDLFDVGFDIKDIQEINTLKENMKTPKEIRLTQNEHQLITNNIDKINKFLDKIKDISDTPSNIPSDLFDFKNADDYFYKINTLLESFKNYTEEPPEFSADRKDRIKFGLKLIARIISFPVIAAVCITAQAIAGFFGQDIMAPMIGKILGEEGGESQSTTPIAGAITGALKGLLSGAIILGSYIGKDLDALKKQKKHTMKINKPSVSTTGLRI